MGTQRWSGSVWLPPMHSLSARHGRQIPTLPRAVPVQVLVAGSQEFWPQAEDSVERVHSTQVPASQTCFSEM
jgi:hypothetical protein